MLFATTSLARRIELAECSLIGDIAHAVERRLGAGTVMVAPLSGGTAVFAGSGTPFNKLAGLGFEPLDEPALATIEHEFERRSTPLQVELASLSSNTDVGATLTRRGYSLVGFENVLGLPLGSARPASSTVGVAITRAASSESPRWIDVVATGFSNPDTFDGPATHDVFDRDALEQIIGMTGDVPGFARYLARRDGVILAGGAMRMWNGVAQMCGAATLPEHRRQGAQTALLAERLNDAAREGCDIAIVTTQPGSRSQANMQRQGFALLYTRALLVRAPGAVATD